MTSDLKTSVKSKTGKLFAREEESLGDQKGREVKHIRAASSEREREKKKPERHLIGGACRCQI